MTTLVLRQLKSLPGFSYVLTTLMQSLLRQHLTTSSLRFFEHVQSSSTSSTLVETIPRPYRFVLRSYYDVQVLTASIRFLRTW